MQPVYQEEEIEIDLKGILIELLEHWKMVILSTVLFAVAVFLINSFLLVPKYQSTSELYVLSKSTSITSVADIQTGTSLTNDYLVVATDRPVVEQVIANLGLSENYKELKEKIAVSNPTDSRILKITVTDESNTRAKRIADEMADVVSAYISAKMDQNAPSVISYGYDDEEPVGPHIYRNTAVGAIVGFIFACVVIVIRLLLSDTIMTPEDLEKKMDIHLLGVLFYEDFEHTGEAPKAGKRRKKKNQADMQKKGAE